MKLIEGHTYEDGNGNSHKVTMKGGWADFPFTSGTRTWTAQGSYLTAYATDCDLIKDVTGPALCLADDKALSITVWMNNNRYKDRRVDETTIEYIHELRLSLRRKEDAYNRLVAKGIFHARERK